MPGPEAISRAVFLKRAAGLSVLVAFDRSVLRVGPTEPAKHPDPRPGITAEKVLRADDLGERPRKSVTEAYEAARQFPEVFDGIACDC